MVYTLRTVFFFAIVCILLALSSEQAAAQDFPSRPIRLVVADTPGTGTDLAARLVAPEMSKILGQPVLVDNKPGAASIIGYEYVAKQVPADGYTIASVSATQLETLPLIVKDLRFDPIKDLTPIIGLVDARNILATSSRSPWRTLNELVTHAKANPGKMNYGAPSPNGRLVMEGLIWELGLQMTFVPYRAAGPYLNGLVADPSEIQWGFIGEPTAISFGGKIRVLAVTGEQRAAAFPDAPTFVELGLGQIPGLSYGLHAPAGTPRAVIERLYGAASRTLEQPEIRTQMAKLKWVIVGRSPDVAAKRLAEEARLFAEIARRAGIQPQ